MIGIKSLATEARHLIAVARAGLKHGDTTPAAVNLRRYKTVLETAPHHERELLTRVVRVFGRLLSRRPKTDAGKIAALPAGIPPTPETAAKARKELDPIQYMNLTGSQQEAASQIRAIYEQLIRGLQAKGTNLNMDRVDVSLVVREPWDGMRDDLQVAFTRYYIPWYRRLRAKRVRRWSRTTANDVVFLVLFELAPLCLIDKSLGMADGGASSIVRAALDDYWRGRAA